jgi:hypothetical protein
VWVVLEFSQDAVGDCCFLFLGIFAVYLVVDYWFFFLYLRGACWVHGFVVAKDLSFGFFGLLLSGGNLRIVSKEWGRVVLATFT